MAFGDKMDKVEIYKKNEERPSGSGAKEDCFFCNEESIFVVIGQRPDSNLEAI